jgi:hypothetical protein
MADTVSFLLGSGFSAADGVPLISDINRQLLEIKEDDIYIHSDMTAMLLKGQTKPPFRINWKDEKFFVEFLSFYSNKVIGNPADFNYEILFDYLTAFSRFGNHKGEIHDFFFCEYFRKNVLKHSAFVVDDVNLLYRFEIYFTNIVSNFLQVARYYEDIGLGNYPPYDSFANFIRDLLKSNLVKVHTLNHDLLFEHLASKLTDLWQHFTDGFDENNSPYYGEVSTTERIHKTYRVRLKKFTDKFEKPLALYKLHGSIDTYIADITSSDHVRIKKDYGVSTILQEVFDNNTKQYSYTSILQKNYPDFLSGTTAKISQYNIPYYQNLLKRFEENLENSKLLFVIGYGFKDEGINNILIKRYLASGKRMIVINRSIPKSNLITDFNIKVIEKPFVDVVYNDYHNELQA